jgi:hypothetical protein
MTRARDQLCITGFGKRTPLLAKRVTRDGGAAPSGPQPDQQTPAT